MAGLPIECDAEKMAKGISAYITLCERKSYLSTITAVKRLSL
jgi:hypothetical protein